MKFLRLFSTDKNSGDSWTLFTTSQSEVQQLLVSMGQLTIAHDFLKIENYPFEPSAAYRQSIFRPDQIHDMDIKSHPPTFRTGRELIFLNTDQKAELKNFAERNAIKTVERPMVWEWILEPFLDTEFTAETDQKLTDILEKSGLTADRVKALRAEVEEQMLKYNFDTMLWEWCGFDASDVLRAMRTKYKKEAFKDFYQQVMDIALLKEKDESR